MQLLCVVMTNSKSSVVIGDISITTVTCHYVLLFVPAAIVSNSRRMNEIVPFLKHYFIDYG